MGIKIPAITRMSNLANTASNLQQAITGMAQFDETIGIELERKRRETLEKEKQEVPFDFNVEEIDANVGTLVLRNKFIDRLAAQTKITQAKKELQTEIKETKQNTDREI